MGGDDYGKAKGLRDDEISVIEYLPWGTTEDLSWRIIAAHGKWKNKKGTYQDFVKAAGGPTKATEFKVALDLEARISDECSKRPHHNLHSIIPQSDSRGSTTSLLLHFKRQSDDLSEIRGMVESLEDSISKLLKRVEKWG